MIATHRLARSLIIGSTFLIVTSSAVFSLNAAPIEQFKEIWSVNNWKGFIFYNEQGGFDRCSAIVNFVDGTTVGFFIQLDGTLSAKITNDTFDFLPVNRPLSIAFKLDDHTYGPFSGHSTRKEQALLDLGQDSSLLTSLRKSRSVTISGDANVGPLSLKDSSTALPKMASCIPHSAAEVGCPPPSKVVEQALNLPPDIPPGMLGIAVKYCKALTK